MMILIAALVGAGLIVQLVGLLAAVLLLPAWVDRQKAELRAEIEAQARAFVESKGDQPSPLAILTDQLATLFAGRLWQQVEARLRGSAGSIGREENQQAEAAMAGSGPLAALAMAFLPKKAKLALVKNPQFLGALSGLLGKNNNGPIGSGQAPGPGHNFKMEM